MAHSIEKRIARIEEDRVEVRRGDRTLRVRFPRRHPLGER